MAFRLETEELDIADLKTSARGATFVLGLRQCISQALGVISGIVLARLMTPAEFGMGVVANFLFYLCLAAGDLGLGAAIIRDRNEPSPRVLRLVLLVRQCVDISLVCILLIAAPRLAELYGTGADGIWLFRLLGLAVLLQSFQIVPTILLERELGFTKLAVVEICQAAVQASLLIGLAFSGWGIVTFGIAWCGFSFTGALLANAVKRWPIGWHWDKSEFMRRLPFSLPYQATGAANLIRDGVTPLVVGLLLGAEQIGYLSWAQMLATAPALLLLILPRVYLPTFSKLQNNRLALGHFLEHTLFTAHALAAPLAILTLVYSHAITMLIFGSKWLVALPFFYGLWLANFFAPTLIPLQSLLNALGKPRRVLWFSLTMAACVWIFALPLVSVFGSTGYVAAFVGAQFLTLALVRLARSELPFTLLPSFLPPWCAAIVSGALVYTVQIFWPVSNIPTLFCQGIIGLGLYATLLIVSSRFSRAATTSVTDSRNYD